MITNSTKAPHNKRERRGAKKTKAKTADANAAESAGALVCVIKHSSSRPHQRNSSLHLASPQMDLLYSVESALTMAFWSSSRAVWYSMHLAELEAMHSSSRDPIFTEYSPASSISPTMSHAARASALAAPKALDASSAAALAARYADSSMGSDWVMESSLR